MSIRKYVSSQSKSYRCGTPTPSEGDDLMEDVEEAMEEVVKKEEVVSGRKRGAIGRGNKGSTKSTNAETPKRGKTSASLPKEVVEGRGRRERMATTVKEASEPPTTEEEEIPPPVQVDEPAQAQAAPALPQEEEEEEEEEEPPEAPMEAPNMVQVQVLPAEVRVSESLASTDRASASPPCEVTSILHTHLHCHTQSLHLYSKFSPYQKLNLDKTR